jgi:hypothetical protein
MNETLNVAQYFYLHAAQRPGEAARLLGALRESGVNLLALSGFPAAAGPRSTSFPRIRPRCARPRAGTAGNSPAPRRCSS